MISEVDRIRNQLVFVEAGSHHYGPLLRDAADNLVVELAKQGNHSVKVTAVQEKLHA